MSSSQPPVKETVFSYRQSVFIMLLCASFLFYKYVLQVYPGCITGQLMKDFHLNGAGLGNLAATFYYSYMIMQFFVGIMLDKWGARKLTTLAIFCSALGAVLFSQSYSLLHAGLSRGLMGIGVAFATVAYMKLAALWFPPQRYALVGGLLATAAMAGAVFGEAPLSWFISQVGWRTSLLYLGIAGLVLALVFGLVVRDAGPHDTVKKDLPSFEWRNILDVFKKRRNWLLTFYSGLAFAPLAIFGGL